MGNQMILFIVCYCFVTFVSGKQSGPDPWNNVGHQRPQPDDYTLPPDLRSPLKKEIRNDNKFGFGEWWFRRLLAIMLKSGQVKINEDGYVDTSIIMRFDEDKWKNLEESLKSEAIFTDDVFRRVTGYIEEAIYKPNIADKIVMAWSEYIQVYLNEYKTYITYALAVLSAAALAIWLCTHLSRTHVIIIVIVSLYIYEGIISYIELEQKDYDKLMQVLSNCKWYFWQECNDVPKPDPIVFLKHMNPMKIAIRMFTSFISEPILSINAPIKVIVEDITDGLWYPVNKMVYGILIVFINMSLIYLLVMITFNFLFNIGFNFSFWGMSIGVKEKKNTLLSNITNDQQTPNNAIGDGDRRNEERLDRIINLCHALAVNNAPNRHNNDAPNRPINDVPLRTVIPRIRRSSSTGRLPNLASRNNELVLRDNIRWRNVRGNGDGDH